MFYVVDLEKANYKLHGRIDFQGIDISVENRKGSYRAGVDKDGHEWRTQMKMADYGRIIGVPRKGSDGEHVDAFVGPSRDSQRVFIIHIKNADDGKYDEDKCFLGFNSKNEVKKVFDANYDAVGRRLYMGMTEMDLSTFKQRLEVQSEGMIKSHVKGHYRRTKSGKISFVKEYRDEREARRSEPEQIKPPKTLLRLF